MFTDLYILTETNITVPKLYIKLNGDNNNKIKIYENHIHTSTYLYTQNKVNNQRLTGKTTTR